MAEGGGGGGAKVRVVRCPKCQKLLPELPNFTVYRCGSCGATLQAKKQNPAATEASPASSDGERMKNIETLVGSPEKKELVSDACSETGGDGDTVEAKKEEPVLMSSASEFRSEETNVSREPTASKLDEVPGGDAMEDRENSYHSPSRSPVRDVKPNVDELVKENVEPEVRFEWPNGSHNVHQVPALNGEERDRASAFRRPTRARADGIRLTPYPDEGPSNYYSNPRYRHGVGGPIKKHNSDASHGIEHLEQDRAELLRKLDELRDQLRRSCEIADKPNERPPMSWRTVSTSPYGSRGRAAWFPEGPSSLGHASAQHSSFLNGHNGDVPNFYPTLNAHNEVSGYGEPFVPQTMGRAPFHHPGQYPRRPLDNYLYGQFDPDPFISYHHDGLYHQPACSCVHCYSRHWPVPMPSHAPPVVFNNQKVPYLAHHRGVYPVHNPLTFGPRGYNQRTANDSSHSHEPRSHQKAASNRRDVRSLRPVAGAAPFIVCYNCFELLQLPQKFPLAVKSKHKLQCGSCSQVISFELDGKRFVTHVPPPTSNVASETNNNSSDGMKDGLPSHPRASQHPVISYSVDYDSPGYDLPSTDEKLILPSPFSVSSNEPFEKEYGLDVSEPEKVQGLSSSSSTSENAESRDSLICQRNVPSSTELPLEADETSHAPGVPLREHFGYPSSNQVMDGLGKGSRSKRSDQEKILLINGNFKQNSVKDVQVATEMDVSVDECPNHGASEDSWEIGNDEDHPRVSKGGESFLAGLIKKSFRDFPRFNSVDNGRSKVSINGHPISDRLVKKAEKQAGHILPGEYWYDYRAGFWGIMRHHCLGIIPPFIEEFNYPMPKNCAGGDTGVFVNGRELHQKDLDLLAGRGLPPTRGQSYIIEISGKVWDEATGEELDSLGKLAPTVEKVKHGFGMRVPRVIA